MHNHIEGARCLDLFAGSGILGLEAVSRGAAGATLIERNQQTCEMISRTLAMIDSESVNLHKADALQWLKRTKQAFEVIFLDPPFGTDLVKQSLALLLNSACITGQTLIYVESNHPWLAEDCFEVLKQGKAGQVNYALLRILAV